jgi:hypothetical protein
VSLSPYGDADIAFLLRDCGLPVHTPGTANAGNYGVFDRYDQVLVDDAKRGQINVIVPSVSVQASAFPEAELAIDQPIWVDGTKFMIRDRDAEGDGALKKLYLRRA